MEKFHPSDWDLDHDHRLTWFGMVKMENEKHGDLQDWSIYLDKKQETTVNIGFKKPPLRKQKARVFSSKDRCTYKNSYVHLRVRVYVHKVYI